MSDESIQSATTDVPATAQPGGIKGFFATTLGKIVLIGGAVVLLLAIITVVAAIVLGALGVGLFQEAVNETPGVIATPTTGSPMTTAAVAAVPVIENSEVFTPRDPFQPVVIPASAIEVEAGGASADDDNTLTLLEIIEENGVRRAVLRLGATNYTLSAGERLDTTPWKVVSIGTTSVTMLYGDSQIVLTVGQGVQTK